MASLFKNIVAITIFLEDNIDDETDNVRSERMYKQRSKGNILRGQASQLRCSNYRETSGWCMGRDLSF